MMVAFIAPWCVHCQMLKPIYEHAAQEVQRRMAGRNTQGRWQRDLALATVDCTTDVNDEVCTNEHIQAFPTIRVFRRGSDRKTGMHESYRGDRSAEAITDFAMKALEETEAQKAIGAGTDFDGDGRLDSYVHSLGCRVDGEREAPAPARCRRRRRLRRRRRRARARMGSCARRDARPRPLSSLTRGPLNPSRLAMPRAPAGYIRAPRVPGSITFSPHAIGHDFHVENINMSHVVHGLSFGKPIAKAGVIPSKYRNKVPSDLGGAYASDTDKSATLFTTLREKVTYEHFVKVVPTAYQALRSSPVEAYEYTINSNQYQEPEDEVPHVRFTYDLSPMQVVVRETSRPLIDGVVGLLAIMGGVYTAFMMVEGMLRGALRTLKKQREGKLG